MTEIYFQPDADHMNYYEIPSWFVWRSASECRADNRDARCVLEFIDGDIEDHVYVRRDSDGYYDEELQVRRANPARV